MLGSFLGTCTEIRYAGAVKNGDVDNSLSCLATVAIVTPSSATSLLALIWISSLTFFFILGLKLLFFGDDTLYLRGLSVIDSVMTFSGGK